MGENVNITIIPEPHYLKDRNNIKVYTNESKEIIHRELWKDVFKKEEKEGNNNTEFVFEYLKNNLLRTIPYANTDLSRLIMSY